MRPLADDSGGLNQISSSPNENNTTGLILAMEVIGRGGSVALTRAGEIIASVDVGNDDDGGTTAKIGVAARSAAMLVPTIDRVMRDHLPADTIPSAIAVATGPGSFTGLRVAVTTAKSLAYAWNIPVIAIGSLEAIAKTVAVGGSDSGGTDSVARTIVVALAAYRGQVYRAVFGERSSRETDIVSGSEFEAELTELVHTANLSQPEFVCLGDRKVFEKCESCDAIRYYQSPPPSWAIGVAKVAEKKWHRGETVNPMNLVPDYLRPSAAEE